MIEYKGIICPACEYQTSVDPAFLTTNSPMPYCPNCKEPLLDEPHSPDEYDINSFDYCDDCDTPDKCEEFGCAAMNGIKKY